MARCWYIVKHRRNFMFDFKLPLNRLNANIFKRLGEDLRKAAYLIGMGFVGMIVANDQISFSEAFVLTLWGFDIWVLGHWLLYVSEKITNIQKCLGE